MDCRNTKFLTWGPEHPTNETWGTAYARALTNNYFNPYNNVLVRDMLDPTSKPLDMPETIALTNRHFNSITITNNSFNVRSARPH
jgi:hypothetical protein